MELFRYSFETDEQYLERAQQVQGQVEIERVPEAESPSQGGGFGFVVPWWVVAAFAFVILLLVYREMRQRLRRRGRTRGVHPSSLER